MAKIKDHVSPLAVPAIAFVLAFAAVGFVLSVWMLGSILSYGLFGEMIDPPSTRVVAFVFSIIFVLSTILGWVSWLCNLFSKDASK